MGRKELADELNALMGKRGVGPTELARLSGVSRSHIDRILKCGGDPRMETLRALARALHVHSAHLIGRLYADYERPLNRSGRQPKYRDFDSAFVRDVTYPDNSPVATNQRFEKIWEIQNVGKMPWEGFVLRNVDDQSAPSYLKPDSPEVELPRVEPGDTIQVAMMFQAPRWAGTVVSRWRMFDRDGELVFPEKDGIWCQVVVEDV